MSSSSSIEVSLPGFLLGAQFFATWLQNKLKKIGFFFWVYIWLIFLNKWKNSSNFQKHKIEKKRKEKLETNMISKLFQ
jgi:hypothetical protein